MIEPATEVQVGHLYLGMYAVEAPRFSVRLRQPALAVLPKRRRQMARKILPWQIPDPVALPFDLVPIPRDLRAGEPVYWHLSNHGQKSWHLIEVSANP